ncbi:alpha-ketoglutarate-dependent sulfonate dioxygenase, putative [Talaromyces stipitatus ATCC 10500]|uniref:Alpha-ketoglutarate-dependent sulfonate dioxygenase, putative n=1 Tax=Talaromyces stipitatus (strain ATCC 10500 / CBS 375.48 / QM 6759 / NRRL 1006) TaxID=441959 RepID=B8MNB0_TALSN|nr:alpha-ketoglutarate-dependent sulfonate dioxygenase, putative [Talaromyces stipitatus ATCC 10500]EED13999.1 alpha-ketoglutarate-dependent sulfonate dioxygenase, putative [Talaromyces stipitatus ATCC 10500]
MIGAHTGLNEKVLAYRPSDPPVEEIRPPKDRAFFADLEKRSLLSAVTKVKHLTPYIGTELQGVQLSQLDEKQKNELALLVAERGVVFFRDQDLTLEGQHEFTKHFGIVDLIHLSFYGRLDIDIPLFSKTGTLTKSIHVIAFAEFHSDHSFEINPPSYTLLRMVKTPEYGGDTIWTSQTALFDKLSPTFQKTFEGLHGVHSSEHTYINTINRGGTTFRLPVRREHPLVRTHPVTKQKALFYNPAFVIHIAELKGFEALHTLNFLREHLHSADDLTVRWQWEAGSIALWDNRVAVHRAVPGGYNTEEREGKRTAVYGEKPFYDPSSKTLSEWQAERNQNEVPVIKTELDGF